MKRRLTFYGHIKRTSPNKLTKQIVELIENLCKGKPEIMKWFRKRGPFVADGIAQEGILWIGSP